MGKIDPSTRSSAEALEALHGAPIGVPAISEDEAWAIAMAWDHQLQSIHNGHERLRLKMETIRDDPFSVVDSYAWVKIRVNTRDDAAVARAATLAWFWLSCCPGYSARENPRFWKRVFNELQREQPSDESKYPPSFPVITDAMRFFDAPGCEFPRIHLEYQDVAQCETFFGASLVEREEEKLEFIRLQLKPHMVPSRTKREIAVRLEDAGNAGTNMTGVAAMLTNPTADLPRLALHSVLAHAPQLLHRLEFEFTIHTSDIKTKNDASYLSDSSVSRSSESTNTSFDRVCVQSLRLYEETAASGVVGSVCSSLPYSSAVSSVSVVSPAQEEDATQESVNRSMTWAWLGYAIFHPESKHSSWRNLDVSADNITPDTVAVLESMAKGNNFVNAELNSQDYTSYSYHTVRICPGTTVRVSPNHEAPATQHIGDATYAYLCVDSSDRAFELNGWARVVLPAVGFGWVCSTAITGISSHAPGESWLRGLRVRGGKPCDIRAVLRLLVVTGARLERLDIGGCGALSADQLRQLLLACPALKSLTVSHDSTMLSQPMDPKDLSRLPHLEQLSMSLVGGYLHLPRQEMLNSVFQQLSALRILTTYQAFSKNRPAVSTFVSSLRKLTYLHVCDPNERANTRFLSQVDDAYILGRINTRKWLGDAFFQDRQVDARTAFLSVVQAKQSSEPSSAVARINRDLSSAIFAFASGSLLRDVWVGECTEV